MDVAGCRLTKGGEKDWANLPPELLQLIVANLTNICDYIRFRSVCTSWRSVAGQSDLQPQIPWLVVPSMSTNTISFYSLSDQRHIYALNLPGAQGKWIYGSAYGWLLMIGSPASSLLSSRRTVSLLNPITRAQILLPQLPVGLNLKQLKKAVLCAHPPSARHGHLLVAVLTKKKVAFFKDNDWTLVSELGYNAPRDIAYFEERIYILDYQWELSVLDVETSKVSRLIHPRRKDIVQFAGFSIYTLHLAEAAGNLLLLACSLHKINVFKLDKSPNGVLKWAWKGFVNSTLPLSSVYNVQSVYARGLPDSGRYQIYTSFKMLEYTPLQVIEVVDSDGIYDQPCCQVPESVWSQRRWFLPGLTWLVPSLN